MQRNPSPRRVIGRPRDGVSLGIATILSLLLHALIAGGLVTTGLGIISTVGPDPTAAVRSIFRPKLAVDFPLEVSRSEGAAGAHENPLDLASPRLRSKASQPRPADPERHVSQKTVPEQPQDMKVRSQLPQRAEQPADERLVAAERLERADLRPTDTKTVRATVPTIAASTDETPSPAAPSRSEPAPRQADPTTSAPRAPREVALLANTLRNRTPASRPVDAMAPDAPLSRAPRLSRQNGAITPPAQSATTPDALAPASMAEPEAVQPRARPRSAPAGPASSFREPIESTARLPADDSDTADPIATARRQASASSVARGTRIDTTPSPSLEITRSAPARAGVASAIAEGAATAAVAIPAGVSGSGSFDAAGDDASIAAPRPGPSRGSGERREAARSAVVAGQARGDHSDSKDGDASEGAASAPSSSRTLASLGWQASQGGGFTGGEPSAASVSASPSPARAGFIAAGAEETGSATVAPLAGPGGSGSGQEAHPDGAPIASAVGGPRPIAPSFRGGAMRGSGGEPRSAVARGGATTGLAGEAPAESEWSGEDEGLSQDGTAAILESLALDSSNRRNQQEGTAASQTSALPRVTAFALPVEERVRDIAAPFMNRLREKRDSLETDAIVDRGLDFLKRSQRGDGRWQLSSYPGAEREQAPKLSSDTAATGLALLAFLGAGHDHFGGAHRETVRRGLEFLIASQKENGDLYLAADPLSDSCAWLYSHAIATMALCEAVGMTGDQRIRPAAERACRFISASQHPDRGGWRYTPRSDADLSVSGWMLVALRSGELAGVPVDRRTIPRVVSLLDASTIPPAAARTPLSRFHYNVRKPEQRPSELSIACMNALGTLMRLHTGWTATDSRVVANAGSLAALRPTYGEPSEKSRDCYLWYYASQVLVHVGGEPWESWYADLADTLGPRQEKEGPASGSWDPLGPTPDRWGQYGGRIYVTAMHLLTLEVPYRRLPTYSLGDDTR